MYSNETERRCEHNGIVKWITEVLNGVLEANYRGQAVERLGLVVPDEEDGTGGGTSWMELDSLDAEELS